MGDTLFIGNLPYQTTCGELENILSEIGPLKRCFIVQDKGIGYAKFAIREDAESAISQTLKISGRKLNLKFAKPKSEYLQTGDNDNENAKSDDDDDTTSSTKTLKMGKKKISKKKPGIVKKGRLIIRNLSFQASEQDIRKEFEKYGNVVEVVIPKKPDGKMFGFCFVQYDKVADAASAIKAMKVQTILGRRIAVDWSVPKKKYIEIKQEKETDVKEHDDETLDIRQGKKGAILKNKIQVSKIKKKASNKNSSSTLNIIENDFEDMLDDKSDDDESDGSDTAADDENVSSSDHEMGEESDNSNDEEESNSDENESDSSDDEKISENETEDSYRINKSKKRTRDIERKSLQSDVNEGKTLFVRNLSFDTTQEKLHATFSKFGSLYYAIICVDPLTEHSKGTGFVKFKTKEDAEKCLTIIEDPSNDAEIILDGQKLQVSRAVTREELQKRADDKKKPKKDNRNLYLAREGLIRPGTKAAEGVSKQDMAKRVELEIWKRRMLQNLHIFISKTRLCVRNLPASINEQKLKKVFLKAAGLDASINEVKIMRNIKKISADGFGESKGFGFVGFEQHEHALQALRNTNNNPLIFTAAQRPIVEFSLENRAVLRAKEKRLEKSRQNINKKESTGSPSAEHYSKTSKTNKRLKIGEEMYKSFVGTKADTLTSAKALPSHVGPKIRHNRNKDPKISRRRVQQEKVKYRERKRKQKSWNKKSARMYSMSLAKSAVTKTSRKDLKLDKMVDNYKRKLESKGQKTNKKIKWCS